MFSLLKASKATGQGEHNNKVLGSGKEQPAVKVIPEYNGMEKLPTPQIRNAPGNYFAIHWRHKLRQYLTSDSDETHTETSANSSRNHQLASGKKDLAKHSVLLKLLLHNVLDITRKVNRPNGMSFFQS